MRPLQVSAELAEIVGAGPMPRSEVVSKLWIYIKKHNLQDEKDKRKVNADEKLKKAFGKDQFGMLEVGGLISKNVS